MGSSNNASSQNAAATQQIQGNTQQAQQALQQYLAQNPSPLAQAGAAPAPQQFGGPQGPGGTANAQAPGSQIPPQILQALMQAKQGGAGAPQMRAPQPPGAGAGAPHPQPPPAQPPPGLLGLLAPPRAPGQ